MPRFFNNILGQSTADCTGVNTGAIQTLGGLYVAKQLQVWGQTTLNAGIASTSSLNGSLVIAGSGGLGVGGAGNFGGSVNVGSGISLDAPSGNVYCSGLVNLASAYNSAFRAQAGGCLLVRNIADANAAATINQQNASSTGDVLALQFASNNVFRVGKDGTAHANAGFDINLVPTPATGSLALILAAGNLGVGTYYYGVAFQTAMGVSNYYQIGSITTDASHKQVTVTIPVSSDPRVTSRVLYRTQLNGSYWTTYILGTVGDNVATTFTDNVADGSLTVLGGFGQLNTTTNFITVGGQRSMVLDVNATFFGWGAGNSNQAGAWQNSFFGYQAGIFNTTGQENSFFGHQAGEANTIGGSNSYFGYEAGANITTGSANTAMGNNALVGIGVGSSDNTVVGYYALGNGPGTGAGNYNTAMGMEAGFNYTASNGLFFGAYAGKYETTNSNVLMIDNLDRSSAILSRQQALLYGVSNATPSLQTLSLGGGGTVTVPGLFNVQSKATLAASVAGAASLSVPNGMAVTAPATGDMWAVGGNLYYYTGSATINLTTGGAGMSNPMTTNGDMIVEAGGVPARLAAGTNGNVLTMVAGAPAWAPPSSGGTTVLGGTAILDFGTNQGAASVAVTGQTGILTTSNIHATVSAVATANKGADEVYMDPIVLSVGPPTAGTGFTIYGTSLNKFTSGQYQVNWSWF